MKFPPELLQSWLERHASLELLCEFDDWPDTAGMQVKLQESASDRLRLLVSLNETMRIPMATVAARSDAAAASICFSMKRVSRIRPS